MTLEKQTVTIPFTGGVEAKLDAALVSKDKLLSLENLVFQRNGTLTKRDGFARLSTSVLPDLTRQAETFIFDNQLCFIGDSLQLGTYSPGSTGSQWLAQDGRPSSFHVRKDRVQGNLASGSRHFDVTIAVGVACYVWRTTASIFVSLVDTTTGAILLRNTAIDSSGSYTFCRVSAVVVRGNSPKFHVYFGRTDNNIYLSTCSIGETTFTAAASIAADYKQGYPFEVLAVSDYCAVVYPSTDATYTVRLLTVTWDGTVQATTNMAMYTDITAANVKCIALGTYTATKFGFFIGHGTTSVYCGVVTYSGGTPTVSPSGQTATTGAQIVTMTCSAESSTSMRVLVDCGTVSTDGYHQNFTYSSAGSVGSVNTHLHRVCSASFSVYGPMLAGKAFTAGGYVFAPMIVNSTYQPVMFLVGVTNTNVGYAMARCLPGVASYNPHHANEIGVIPSCATGDGVVFTCATKETTSFATAGGLYADSWGVTGVSFAFARDYASSDLRFSPLWHAKNAESVFLSGGVLSLYDGRQCAEAGFHLYPEIAAANGSAVAGPATGAHNICAVYEWYDDKGRRHQSTPSPAVSWTSDGAHQCTVTASALPIGWRAPGAKVVVYATAAGGTTYYRASGSVANSTTASYVTLTYLDTDANLALGEILYSPNNVNGQAGTLFNDAPPPCRSIASHQSRIWIGGLEDPYEYRWSQQAVPGVGLMFSDSFRGRIPEGYGEISALGVLDDKLIIFTPTHKFVVTGEGPDETGSGSWYSSPQLLPTDVGCVDQRTIVQMPDVGVQGVGKSTGGLAFQSKHGLYLLDRALTDNYFGSPIESKLSGVTLCAGILLEDKSQARWYARNGASGEIGTELVFSYDLLFDQWSVFTSTSSFTPKSACVYNGSPVFVDSVSSYALTDVTGSGYLDYVNVGTHPVVGAIRTAWLQMGNVAGFQRLWRWALTLNVAAASSLVVKSYWDFSGTASETATYADTSSAPGTGRKIIRHHMAQQKGTAVQFFIKDTPSSGTYAGVSIFSALTLEIGAKRGISKQPYTVST